METIGGDSSKTELVMKKGKHKSTTGIGASLTSDYTEKKDSNNKLFGYYITHGIGHWT